MKLLSSLILSPIPKQPKESKNEQQTFSLLQGRNIPKDKVPQMP